MQVAESMVLEDPGALHLLPEKSRERLLQTLLEGRLKRFTADVRACLPFWTCRKPHPERCPCRLPQCCKLGA